MHSAKRMGRNQVFSADDPIVAALHEADRVDSDLEEQLAVGATDALTLLVENRDSGTGEHGVRVATLSKAVARAMGCPREQVQAIQVAAQLHDIGKVAVPDAILSKAGKLTDEEWEQMRRHPTIGADVVSRMGRLAELAPVVRSHHEHYDGTGYPAGLAGEEIPLEARIIGAVDAFDAMTSDRPYRDAMAVKDAREELRRGAGSQFDPLVIEALDPILDRMGSDGSSATSPVETPDLDPLPIR